MLVISQIVYDWKWTEAMGGREDQEKSRETEGEEETMSCSERNNIAPERRCDWRIYLLGARHYR